MTSQYDTFQGPYDYCRTSSIALIEHENVQSIIAPLIKNAHVLELACGSGFYTPSLLEWGADSVVGVDASAVMLEEARRRVKDVLSHDEKPAAAQFIHADCSIPTPHYLHTTHRRPFDLVFAAWLLVYAPDRASLTQMFRTIALNLKEREEGEGGGIFVGVTTPPSPDPFSSLQAIIRARPPPQGPGFFNCNFLAHVDEGIHLDMTATTPVGDLRDDSYFFRQDVVESAAREAGLNGRLEWHVTSVPERYLRGEGEGEVPGRASLEALRSYGEVAEYGILVIEK